MSYKIHFLDDNFFAVVLDVYFSTAFRAVKPELVLW